MFVWRFGALKASQSFVDGDAEGAIARKAHHRHGGVADLPRSEQPKILL